MNTRIDEMRAQIHTTPMPLRSRGRWPSRRSASLISSGVLGLGLTAGAVAVVLVVSEGTNIPPAYAAIVHTTRAQRTVTITLREERDIGRLNARLAAEHTRIRVVPVVRGCHAPVHSVSNGKVVPGTARTMLATSQSLHGQAIYVVSETISVNTIAGRTLVIPDSRNGLYSGGASVVVGPAPSCVGIGRRYRITH